MHTLAIRLTLAATLLLAGAAFAVLPRGIEAARLIAAADAPEQLADLALLSSFDAARADREIAAALAAGDTELAESLLALADARGVVVAPALRAQVEQAAGLAATALRTTGKFVDGFVVGAPDDTASLAGMLAGDLLVYGDVRDVVREGSHLLRGEAADELVLGLACVGLAVTAGTYASLGAGAPARVGLSVFKAAGRAGRLSARLSAALLHPLRAAIDRTALAGALHPTVLLQPAAAVRGLRAAVKLEKAEGLMRVAGDLGRLQKAAGTRAALDALRLAESPRDVAKLSRLAAAKGNKTRAVLKLLGRGAIALTAGLWTLSSWIGWALLTLVGLAAALKRLAERATLAYLHGRRRARLRRLASAALPG